MRVGKKRVGEDDATATEACSCHPKERPSPEGAGGSRGDPHRTMCKRAGGVPSAKALSRSLEDHLSDISSGGDSYRAAMSGSPGFGRFDGKVARCEKCSATLVALKKQALSLAVHHQLSSKDSSAVSVFLHDNLRVHSSRSTLECRDRDGEQGECGVCGVNLNQLKQEAIHLALSRHHASWASLSSSKTPSGSSFTSGTLLKQGVSKCGDKAPREAAANTVHQPRSRTHSPHSPRSPRTPQRTPQTPRRRGPKIPNPDMDRWVEEQKQLVASASKTVSGTGGNGVTVSPYHQTAEDATLGCGDAGTVQTGPKIPHISRVVTIANSAAMSFLARAAQKLNLTSRKKGLVSDSAPSHLSTCFRGIIQKNPPPVPSSLLQAAARTKDSPNTGKVKVVLRVSPSPSESRTHPPVLRIDPSKRRVVVMESACKSQPHATLMRGGDGKALLKTYTFDAAYPRETTQTEVCADVLADVIRCVVSGSDGCVLGLGCADVGSWSSMVGSDESFQRLGLIPCAISWLYSAVERRKEKTWTDLTVSVSAIELCCGEDETLRDLLAEAVPSLGSVQDSPAAQISLQEDPVYGIQLRNLNRVKAPTAERAASLLDAAITARRHGDIIMPLSHSSIMFFTLHVQPPRTESSTISKVSRGPSRLTMIDVCRSMKGITDSNNSKSKLPHSELGPVILSLLSGHKNIPNKGSKLSMLLRQTLGHVNGQVAVIAQVSDSPTHLQEALFTIQLASRIRRTQKRTKQSTSCSPSGRSLSKERRGTPSLSLRAFHSTGEVDVDIPRIRLCGELDERSSSDQSCDTVIHIDSDGSVQAKAAPTLALPEFVPIIPSLNRSKPDMDDPEFTALLQELLSIPQLQEDKKKEESVQGKLEAQKADAKQPERDCLKCDTFAELQERLGCIDGSEVATDVPKLSSKGSPANKMTTKPQPQKDSGKQTDTEAQQTLLLNQELSFNQTSVGEKKADGTFPGDSFQREDSGLYDCEDGSAASSSEEPLNQTQSLNMICQDSLSEVSNTRPPQLPVSLQDCDVDDQSNSLTLTVQPTGSKGSPKDGDESQPERRTSPVGKSSPISPSLFTPTSSCSSSPSMATSVILGDILPHLPTEEVKEMKATITVTVKQPLDLKGQDELVFSMVEEVTISGALDRGRTNGNIIHFRDTANSPAQAQGSASSQPIRIISNVSEESAAAGCADLGKNPVGQTTEAITQKPLYQLRGEKRFLPSFINPMLINTDVDGEKDGAKQRGNHDDSFIGINPLSVPTKTNTNCSEDAKALEEENGAFAVQNDKKKSDCISVSPLHQISYDTPVFEDAALYNETTENKACGKRPRHTDRSHPRGRERVYPINTPRGLSGGEIGRKLVGNAPERIAASPGCPATIPASFKTTSLPRGWHNANSQESHWGNNTADNHRNPGGVTSSTPCSPRVTLEKRQGRQHSPANRSPCFSSPRKYSMEYRQEASSLARKGAASLFEASSLTKKHDSLSGSIKSPIEDSSRLFSAKLEQLASRTNSLGTTPGDFQTLDRGSSSTSVSSKGSSKGSIEGNCKGRYEVNYKETYQGHYEGDSTLPRASRSPRRTPRPIPMPEQSYHFTTSNNQPSQSPKSTHSKLSAVGKLKIASPKVRRLSAPSTKNLSLSHKGLRQSINRSASLSPDGKIERTSSFLSLSPPWSLNSISRTPSQSSTYSSRKSPIQGFMSGRISDLLKDRETSSTSGGLDKTPTHSLVTVDRLSGHPSSLNHHPLPSPYSRVTAPRMPSHMSGHASDATSVLSGELPPAMGKTSLLFPNRNSVVSSGYESMVRDSEATGSSTSNRDSVSDRSGSLLSIARSSRTSRRRGNTGPHQRRLSHDASLSMRRSASGLRARWVDRGIPEAYEIKVYEIDNVERMQTRAGAGKQGPACFSAKLKFLEHRQQRIAEVRAKYNNLRRELDRAKQDLMLEPAKWNQEFDLWQTFEVDSLEHLEALEVVTARLESKVNLCKANVMMVTCFDVSSKRRQKKRRRTALEQRGFLGI
ncbi:kinesin-like protein KIF26B [Myripristis murdjan]|uniref:kinesin-like protein KIF26B n=1 Tax=Myripristis murdjan TaxID=586833 RepID=UPI001175F8D8|nr:kinesin-like protein KIF26B [Myripristis murdjan]